MAAKLLTKAQKKRLLKNGEEQRAARERGDSIDFRPVVKLFTPDAQATWLLSELYPDDPDVAFGLCDLGMGFPELGDVRISEIEALRGPLNLPVERDLHFTAKRTLSEYAREAHAAHRITASQFRRAPARLFSMQRPQPPAPRNHPTLPYTPTRHTKLGCSPAYQTQEVEHLTRGRSSPHPL